MSYLVVLAGLVASSAAVFAQVSPPKKDAEPLAVGAKAPDFTLTDYKSRQSMSLSALKGKTVIVLFWTLDNLHSRTFLNEIETLARRHGAAGLSVMAVNIKDDRNTVFDFARDRTFTSRLLLGGSAVGEKWGAKSGPAVFVVDAKGVVRDARRTGYSKEAMTDIEVRVKDLLGIN